MDSKSTAEYSKAMEEAGEFILSKLGPAKIALVLGSGLGPFTAFLEDQKVLEYKDIPHLPTTAVAGHRGQLILGTVSGKRILCLAGRTHAYEGYHFHQLCFMLRVLKRIGVVLYVTTNSSGGCAPGMTTGCIMAIRDHVNWFHRNPLYEYVSELSDPHVDMSRVYSSRLISVARRTAKAEGVQLFEGVSATTPGPTYESFTEVTVGARMGVSAFGMSLVPEAVVAYAEGMEVFGCSMITNIAAGIDDSSLQLNHEEVIGAGQEFAPQFSTFMRQFIADVEPKPGASEQLASRPATAESVPLPQPQAPVPLRSEIESAIALIVERAKPQFDLLKNRIEVAFYVSYGMEDLTKYLQNQSLLDKETLVRIPYRDIPAFPQLSRSARGGELCLARSLQQHTAPILFLNGNSLESFNCEEGAMLATLLSELGVEKLVHTFLAASTTTDVRADTVHILGDATDNTTIAAVARVPNQPQYLSASLFNANVADLEDLRLAFRFAGQSEEPRHLMHFLGPSFPTRAEVTMAKMADIPLVGVTSLSLVYASRSLGIDVVGIAGVAYEVGDDPLPDASYVLWRKMRAVIVNLMKGNFLPKHRNEKASSIHLRSTRGADDKQASSRAQVSYHLALPVSQGSLNAVQESAAFLRSKGVQDEADLAVVIDSRLPKLPWKLTSDGTVSFADIPQFPPQVAGTFSWATAPNGKRLLIVHGTVLFNEGRTNAEIGYSVRILQQLKAKRVIFLNEVASYAADAPVNSLVLLRDHFNLAGRNPLFGHNVPEFGIRFSDLGNLYTDTLRTAVRRVGQFINIEIPEVTAAFVMGPVFRSMADRQVMHAVDCQVATTGMIPEVIVARHASIPLAAIGLVKSCIGESTHATKVKGATKKSLVRIIESLLEGL